MRRGALLAFVGVLTAFLAACGGMPRIVVLDDPLTPEEHLNLGVAYEKRGELDLAVKEYEAASGELPLGYLYLGNARFLMEDYDRAERAYRKAVRKMPGNADAHNNLAWLLYTKGERLDEAESHALRALELDPTGDGVYRDTLEKIRALMKEREGAPR
ncbi:MAG: tetratricopeptide repeat protein [Thermodesulfovibrionales bacterium]